MPSAPSAHSPPTLATHPHTHLVPAPRQRPQPAAPAPPRDVGEAVAGAQRAQRGGRRGARREAEQRRGGVRGAVERRPREQLARVAAALFVCMACLCVFVCLARGGVSALNVNGTTPHAWRRSAVAIASARPAPLPILPHIPSICPENKSLTAADATRSSSRSHPRPTATNRAVSAAGTAAAHSRACGPLNHGHVAMNTSPVAVCMHLRAATLERRPLSRTSLTPRTRPSATAPAASAAAAGPIAAPLPPLKRFALRCFFRCSLP